jgi:hypothetical protein
MKFTKDDLVERCSQVNQALTEVMGERVGTRYHASSRNGYTALDEYGNCPDGQWGCLRNIGCGTPIKMLGELYARAFWQLHYAAQNLVKSQAPA